MREAHELNQGSKYGTYVPFKEVKKWDPMKEIGVSALPEKKNNY